VFPLQHPSYTNLRFVPHDRALPSAHAIHNGVYTHMDTSHGCWRGWKLGFRRPCDGSGDSGRQRARGSRRGHASPLSPRDVRDVLCWRQCAIWCSFPRDLAEDSIGSAVSERGLVVKACVRRMQNVFSGARRRKDLRLEGTRFPGTFPAFPLPCRDIWRAGPPAAGSCPWIQVS
jgi:hypothetical protein